MHRRSVLAAGLGLASLGVLPRFARAAGGTPKIGLVMKSLANEFFKDMQEGAVAYAQKRGGFELIPVGIQSETDIDGQIAAVENLITRGVDGMVIAPADSRALLPPVARAIKGGIKVINIDVAFDPESMKKRGIDVAFVGPDNRDGAKMSGDVLAQALGRGGKVVIVEGNPGAENATQRKLGFGDAVTAGGLVLVDSRTAHWETEEANSVFSDMLTAHPDIQGVMAANDSMAIGVVKAIEARGRKNKIAVVSFDDIPAVQPLLADGELLATVDQFGSQLAADGIDEVLKEIAGQTLTGWVKTPLKLVKGKGAA